MGAAQAVRFVQELGSAIEQARLRFLLGGVPAPPEAVAELRSSQRPDGSWPPTWAPDYGSLDATCFRLAQAHQLGLAAAAPLMADALRFLAGRQRSDGSWQEEEPVADLAPPWARPGDAAATLYLTANCGYWLSTSESYRREASAAAAFLALGLQDRGRLASFLQAQWLAAGLWHRLGMPRRAEDTMGYLEERVPELSAQHLTWMITALCASGVQPDHPLVAGAAVRLASLQQTDGRWPSDDGPDYDVHVTLEALFALRLCGWL